MFDMKATTLMRLVLFLLVYFALTNLYICTSEETAESMGTSMDFTVVEVETVETPEGVPEAELGFWARVKEAILGGVSAVLGYMQYAIGWWIDLAQRFFAIVTFDIPFPEAMMDSETGRVLIGFIRGTVGASVSTMLIIVIINFINLIASFIPFVGS